ncbi:MULTISPECIES: 50S ribosomal protein L11 methyltransferase [Caproicibacterium]|jgi:ribosomal protein L11 methyltransferase|uniref:Ribosomal protein L11 methyltransferase n=1 Tax=Caproicibacterium lactatifermentans TaxID=2666138 RepID=A0A859DRW0_9FIRM|nr:50S ribosomal protein L11 methyltransferase [Caproicibacterium lactatifermentans]ARP49706.1 ribosomal protein L11 methyltransferase [Ruminococcaceae bacterium CPB6]MDD4807662.1 50S ribosomal protein L11 methyltransferase [Oscillospiraceae bacterium]QKN24560.1 50S ribosomal protein L11 methyltransferase [Caproicibacterium lactatifermentans]QKO30424.1 50S ribosomal protein L11 methyltransferase [Caproicibacterium lactatifermentans]
MDWTEVTVTVPQKDSEQAEAIAQMVVPYGIYIEDYSDLEQGAREIAHINLIDEDLLKKDRSHIIIHVYLQPQDSPKEAVAFLSEHLRAAGIDNTIGTANCRMEDWVNNWKKYFHPMPVGEKLLIQPSWEKPAESGGRIVLHLEPGLAFGTGTHETTRLCMQMLEEYVKRGAQVLDVGCGSGILSVAALLLGADHAVGVDIDELAVKTAKQNAARNGVEKQFTGICGDLTEKVGGTYDVVVANIVADVIIELTANVQRFFNPNAVYLMSGIIDEREEDVLKVLKPDFQILQRREERGWVALAAKLHTED